MSKEFWKKSFDIGCDWGTVYRNERTNIMTLFSINPKLQNRGCGDRSGRWLYEEYQITDSIFGRAAVEYGFRSHRIPESDRHGQGPRFEAEIFDPKVVELIVFDDDGTPVPISAADEKAFRQSVMESFLAQEYDVLEYEGQLQ